LAIAADNPEGFTKWVACETQTAAWAPISPDVEQLLQWAQRYVLAVPLGCAEGEVGYAGAIDLHAGDPTAPDKYKALCRLATLPGMRVVFGIHEYACDGVPCWEGLSCREQGHCPSPCGCCTCVKGERGCGNDIMMQWGSLGITTCEDGCWSDPEWCPFGHECVAHSGAPECDFTCRSISIGWQSVREQGTYCAADSDCLVIPGRCEIGLGPCWIAIHPDETLSVAQVDELAGQWSALGCGASQDCSCGTEPVAKCEWGTCNLVAPSR